MVLQVLGRREHLICKAQESSKGDRFGVTPPAKTRGGAPYRRGRLKGLGCMCEVRASRWHRETINPSAGRRNTASPSASLSSFGQHSLRCNTRISTINALTRARRFLLQLGNISAPFINIPALWWEGCSWLPADRAKKKRDWMHCPLTHTKSSICSFHTAPQ